VGRRVARTNTREPNDGSFTKETAKRRRGPGRPKGSRNKATLGIIAWGKALWDSEVFQNAIWRTIERGQPDEIQKINPILIRLADYGFGRPKYTVSVEQRAMSPFEARLRDLPLETVLELKAIEDRRLALVAGAEDAIVVDQLKVFPQPVELPISEAAEPEPDGSSFPQVPELEG
jgi:hypothetical protein